MKAFLLAAGLGTRLKPFTDHHPKALAPVAGQTLLERNIRYLQQYGIDDVVVNVHHFADQIVSLLDQEKGFGSKVQISDERAAVLETGGGLLHAKKLLQNEPDFLIMNVDILSNFNLQDLIHAHRRHDALATLAVQERRSSRYFLFDAEQRLRGWQNVQTGAERIPGCTPPDRAQWTPRAFSGIQMVQGAIFDQISLAGKFSLVDLYLSICAESPIRAWDHTGDLLLDVGKPESLQQAATLFR